MSISSEIHTTSLRESYPSFLPTTIIRSAFIVALLPVLLVMADPLFNGTFFGGKVMTFEQYQRFLQSATFWCITAMVYLVSVVLSIYLSSRTRVCANPFSVLSRRKTCDNSILNLSSEAGHSL